MQKLLRITACVFFIFIVKHASSQNSYINHTLKIGESLSALAKQYNTNVGDIMRMNGMHADSKLVYGSVIKIPSAKTSTTSLTKTNTSKTQETQTVKQEVIVPPSTDMIKHTVVKGETLYSISKKYNVSVEQLKSWNHLVDNSAKIGSILVVGKDNSSITTDIPADTKRQRVETTVQPQQENTVVNNVVENNKTDNGDSKINGETSSNQIVGSENNNIMSTASFTQNGAGYFQEQFNTKAKHKKHVSGLSKTFKTASGWSDGKYYILADNINPGTIVKLTADNGRSVYAKVLWNMSDLKEGNDADFRISNATAAALNESNSAFNLTVYY